MVITAMLFSLSGCFGYHRITIRKDHKENVISYPKFARAGQTVKIETVSVDDADMYVRANGVECRYTGDGYEFVMPDNDVEITVVIVSNGLA